MRFTENDLFLQSSTLQKETREPGTNHPSLIMKEKKKIIGLMNLKVYTHGQYSQLDEICKRTIANFKKNQEVSYNSIQWDKYSEHHLTLFVFSVLQSVINEQLIAPKQSGSSSST